MIKLFKQNSYRWSVFGLATLIVLGVISLTNAMVRDTHAEGEHKQIVKDIIYLAEQGKVLNNSQFGLNSTLSDIKKEWGNPDTEQPQVDDYVEYNKNGVGFEFPEDEIHVETVHNLSCQRLRLTFSEIQKQLGDPIETEQHGEKDQGVYYFYYKAGKNILRFTFHYNENGTETLSHYYVSID